MKKIFRAVWQLLCYTVIGLPGIIILSPSAPFINKNETVFNLWIGFDRLVCTIVHFTNRRTVSGWTGQWMYIKPRYKYQAMVIDKLAMLFGDDLDHCFNAYVWEIENGWVK